MARAELVNPVGPKIAPRTKLGWAGRKQ